MLLLPRVSLPYHQTSKRTTDIYFRTADYDSFGEVLRKINERDDVLVTVLQGVSTPNTNSTLLSGDLATGKWFCAWVFR